MFLIILRIYGLTLYAPYGTITIWSVIFMKPEKFQKIVKGKYSLKDMCIYKGEKPICNFYIKSLSVNRHAEKEISFSVTLKSKEDSKEVTLPLCYLNDPSGWLKYSFDATDFRCLTTRNEFDKSINEIIDLMIEQDEIKRKDLELGWILERINDIGFGNDIYSFNLFDDPTYAIYPESEDDEEEDLKLPPVDCITEYSKLIRKDISSTLFSYMLLALLTSFNLVGRNSRPDFVVAVTGSTESNRRKVALFFTNLFKRNLSFGRSDYNMIHIMNDDSFMDIRLKSEFAKDCVLIAFEPDTKHLHYLLKAVYGVRNIDEENPIRSMCLITTEEIDNKNGNIININLPDSFDFSTVENFFSIYDPIRNDHDNLMDSIYHYVSILLKKLMGNRRYVNDQFIEYRNSFIAENSHEGYTEASYEAALLMSFSYWLYITEYNEQNPEMESAIHNTVGIITRTVKDSFMVKGRSSNMDFSKAKEVCSEIDLYFTNKSNRIQIGKLGEITDSIDIHLLYDDEYFYIRINKIKEIVKLANGKDHFSMRTRAALSEREIIDSYQKRDGKPEYTVHIKKPLSGDQKTKKRFVAFNRAKCKKYNLFEELEKYCLSVAPQKDDSDRQSSLREKILSARAQK